MEKRLGNRTGCARDYSREIGVQILRVFGSSLDSKEEEDTTFSLDYKTTEAVGCMYDGVKQESGWDDVDK